MDRSWFELLHANHIITRRPTDYMQHSTREHICNFYNVINWPRYRLNPWSASINQLIFWDLFELQSVDLLGSPLIWDIISSWTFAIVYRIRGSLNCLLWSILIWPSNDLRIEHNCGVLLFFDMLCYIVFVFNLLCCCTLLFCFVLHLVYILICGALFGLALLYLDYLLFLQYFTWSVVYV